MKRISLTQNNYALIDDEDFDRVNRFKWYFIKGYARRTWRINGKRFHCTMHQFILGTNKGHIIDHHNHNGTDNRKLNLRVCTNKENMRNMVLKKNSTSGFKGLTWREANKKYQVRIKADGKHIELGFFDNPIEAAKAYDQAALKYHGAYACTNAMLGLL